MAVRLMGKMPMLRHVDRLRSLGALLPIARSSVQMHHRENFNPAILDAVDDSEGKLGNAALSPHLIDGTIHIGMSLDTVDSFRYGFKETPPEAGLLGFVIYKGLQKLHACFRMKPTPHLCSFSAASLNTSSDEVN